jgi:hypothetical protein
MAQTGSKGVVAMPYQLTLAKNPNLRITAHDHTLIMQQLMERSDEVATLAGWKTTPAGNGRMSALEAVRKLPGLPVGLVDKLDVMIANLPALQQAQSRVSAAARAKAETLKRELRTQKDVAGMLAFLRGALQSNRFTGDKALAVGVRMAVEVLEDGMSTIYSPNYPFYRQPTTSRPGVTPWDDPPSSQPSPQPDPIDIATEDANGAIDGAQIGEVVGEIVGAAGVSETGGLSIIAGPELGEAGGAAFWGGLKSGEAIVDVIAAWWGGK